MALARRTAHAIAARRRHAERAGLTVAVTGPTGDVGRAAVRALEARPEVGRIIGMARRPFDPAEHGWKRTEYRQGDILDRDSVDALVAEADVVVHLAFIIFGDHDEAHEINLKGSRNVFEAAATPARSGSSTRRRSPPTAFTTTTGLLTEDVPAARLRRLLLLGAQGRARVAADRHRSPARTTDAYVFRPSIVAGADALTLVTMMTSRQPARRGDRPAAQGRSSGCRSSSRCSPTPGCRCSSSTPRTSPTAIAAAVAGEGPARRLQPRRPRRDDASPTSPASSAGRRCRSRRRRSPRSRRRSSGRRSPRRSPSGSTRFRTPVLMDGSKAERELGHRRVALRRRDADRDDRGRPRERACSEAWPARD